MTADVNPHVVECEECGLRVIKGSESSAEEIRENHNEGDCPADPDVFPRGGT